MPKPSRPKAPREMITVYGKIPRELADRLDRLAEQRRWSRAQMVAWCIEHFVEYHPNESPEAPPQEGQSPQ